MIHIVEPQALKKFHMCPAEVLLRYNPLMNPVRVKGIIYWDKNTAEPYFLQNDYCGKYPVNMEELTALLGYRFAWAIGEGYAYSNGGIFVLNEDEIKKGVLK